MNGLLTDNITGSVEDPINYMSAGRQNVYLFDIVKDPEERNDLSQSQPLVVRQLLERLAMWNSSAVPVNYPPVDKNCNPNLRGGVWGPWM